jgi:phage gp36-like protein
MTQYASKAKLLTRYPVLTEMTDADITNALADADAIIDGYLASKFTIDPLVIPRVVERVCCDLACYFLQKSNLQAQAEESHSRLYRDCIDTLSKIANGTITAFEASAVQESGGEFEVISTGGEYQYRL